MRNTMYTFVKHNFVNAFVCLLFCYCDLLYESTAERLIFLPKGDVNGRLCGKVMQRATILIQDCTNR